MENRAGEKFESLKELPFKAEITRINRRKTKRTIRMLFGKVMTADQKKIMRVIYIQKIKKKKTFQIISQEKRSCKYVSAYLSVPSTRAG